MRTRILSVFVALFIVTEPLAARFLVGGQTFQEMFNKADLVVVAMALKAKDTTERRKLIDIDVIDTTAPELLQDEVIGLETEFQTFLVLKGPRDTKKFVLHHYRLQGNPEEVANGPMFIEIRPQGHYTFLMFLKKEKDGRYAPVTGQFDPAAFSVLDLRSATPDSIGIRE